MASQKNLNKAVGDTEIPQWQQTVRSTLGGQEKVAIVAPSAGVLTLDAAVANVFYIFSLSSNITSWVWNNLPTADTCKFRVLLTMGATLRTVALPSGTIHWMTPQPVHEVNKVTVWDLVTYNGGSDWFISAYVEDGAEDNLVGGREYLFNNAI